MRKPIAFFAVLVVTLISCASCAPNELYRLDIVCDEACGGIPGGGQIYIIGDYHKGEKVNGLTVRSHTGWYFKEWTIYSTGTFEINGTIDRTVDYFIMPSYDVTLVAVFVPYDENLIL